MQPLLYCLPHSITAQTVTSGLFNSNDIQQKQIDPNKPVGVVDGTASVTLTGAATYTIPIKCPSGTNGLQPSIAIGYSSQSGNGIMGIGWNISGLSAITTKTYNNGFPLNISTPGIQNLTTNFNISDRKSSQSS